MIPVDKVEKIEIIDAAMQSGGDGKGGIINIKLKTVNIDGFSGMVTLKPGTRKFKNIDNSSNFCNINYKKNKFIYVNNFSINNSTSINENSSNSNINTFQQPMFQSNSDNSIYKNNSYTDFIGVKYSPSKETNMFFGFGGYAFKNKNSWNETFYEKNLSNENISTQYNTTGNNEQRQPYKSMYFSYWHQFDTNDKYIRMYCNYSYNNSYSDNVNDNIFSIYNYRTIDSLYSEENKRISDNYRIGYYLLFNKPISKNARWNLSYNFNYNIKDNYRYESYTDDTLIYQKLIINNNSSQMHNLSWRIGTKVKKWKFDGGINFNDTYINGNFKRYKSQNSDTTLFVEKNYLKLLPSATIAFAINDTEEVKLTLSQTSNFPYFNQLCNYVDKYNSFYWNSGNSEIKPVDFYSVYLGYTYSKEKWNATVEGFFNYTNNEVNYISYPLTSLLSLSKPSNIAEKTNTGIDLSTWFMVNKKINLSLSSSVFNVFYNTQNLANTATQFNLPVTKIKSVQFGYDIKLNMEYRLKSYYAMFYVNYFSRELSYDGYSYGRINSSFNISRRFLNNRLRVVVGINNIFDNLAKHGSYTEKFGITSTSKYSYSSYMPLYNLTIRYNFRYGDRGTENMKGNN